MRVGPGFQASQTSRAEVYLYLHGDDPVFQQPASGKMSFVGRSADDEAPALIAVSTQKTLGAASGNFSVTIKAPANLYKKRGASTRAFDMRRFAIDDDWIDIVLTVNGERWHVMRGLVDYVQRAYSVGPNGSTTETYTLTGRDFGKIFEDTEVWFNSYTGENLGGGPTIRAFSAQKALFGNVKSTVDAFLFGFLRELSGFGRATWEMPRDMPGIRMGSRFEENCKYVTDGYSDDPARISVNAAFIDLNQGTLWGMAQDWSDPLWCELWCDLVPKDLSMPFPQRPLPENETAMAVILRDRPFPTTAGSQPIFEHPWFYLPTAVIPRQSIRHELVGRGGQERFNAFFATSQLAQEHANQYVNLAQPLWSDQDILRHGLRRMDPVTRYIDPNGNLLGTTEKQRARIRDWHALNPYLYNGTLVLGCGRPDIRCGMRAVIPGETEGEDYETYYVESVSHAWEFGQPIQTVLGVTRGWVGDDASLAAAVQDLEGRYGVAPVILPDIDFSAIGRIG